MEVKSLGHVVLKVRDLERAVTFYKDVLGLNEVARLPKYRMAFFSIVDNHHDIALAETRADAPAPPKESPGLAHVALKIGDSMDDLREAKRWLDQNSVEIDHTSDHKVSQSIYFHDPDGNMLEVFVDADPALWREDPTLVATAEPLAL